MLSSGTGRDRRVGVVPRIDRAARRVRGHRGEECRIADAEAEPLSFHVAARGGDAERWWIGLPRCSAHVATKTPARKSSDMAQKTAQPWRSFPVIEPSV